MTDDRNEPTTPPAARGREHSDCCGPADREPPPFEQPPPFERLYGHAMRLAEAATTDVERMLWTNYARELLAARDARQGESLRASLAVQILRDGVDQTRVFVGECVERLRRPTILEGASSFVENVLGRYTDYVGTRARVRLEAAERALAEARDLGRANRATEAAAMVAAHKSNELREYMDALRAWWESGASFTLKLGGFEIATRPPRPDSEPPAGMVRWEGCPLFPACEDGEEPEEGAHRWIPADVELAYVRVSRVRNGLATVDPRRYAWAAFNEEHIERRWGDGEFLVELVSTVETGSRVIFRNVIEIYDIGTSREFPGPDEVADPAASAPAEAEVPPPGRVPWQGCPLFPAAAAGEKAARGKTWKWRREELTPGHIRLSRIVDGVSQPVARNFDWKTLTLRQIGDTFGPGEFLVELVADADSDNQRIFQRKVVVDMPPSEETVAPDA